MRAAYDEPHVINKVLIVKRKQNQMEGGRVALQRTRGRKSGGGGMLEKVERLI